MTQDLAGQYVRQYGILQPETWEAKGANFQMAVGKAYVADHATPATRLDAQLPDNATAVLGSAAGLMTEDNTGRVRITQATGQQIRVGNKATTSGAAGYIQSTQDNSMIFLEYDAGGLFRVAFMTGVWQLDDGTTVFAGDLVATGPSANSVAKRTSTGTLQAASPVVAADVVTRGYQEGLADWNLAAYGPRTQIGAGLLQSSTVAFGHALGVATDGTLVLVTVNTTGSAVVVFKSTDGGYTWVACATNPSQAYSVSGGVRSFGIYVKDANTFCVAYNNGAGSLHVFAKTTNGGTTWTTNTGATIGTLAVGGSCAIVTDENTAFYIGQTTSTSVKWGKTTNAGGSFTTGTVVNETIGQQTGNTTLATTDANTVYAFWFASANKLRWSKTTNGGTSWSTAADLATDRASVSNDINAVAFSTTLVFVSYKTTATGAVQKILRTTDGSAWSTSFDFIGDMIRQHSAAESTAMFCRDSSGTIYAYTHARLDAATASHSVRKLLWSTDNGATWTKRHASPNAAPASAATGGAMDEVSGVASEMVMPGGSKNRLMYVGRSNLTGTGNGIIVVEICKMLMLA